MNYLDIIIVVVVGFFLVRGAKKGFINTFTGVVSFALALIVATGMMGVPARILQELFNMSREAAFILSYVVLFIGIIMICRGIANILLKLFTITSTRWVDRVGGGVFGLFVGSLIMSVVFVVLSFFSFTDGLLPEKEKSLLYPYSRNFFPGIYNQVKKLKPSAKSFQEIIEDILRGKPEEVFRRSQAGRDELENRKRFSSGKLIESETEKASSKIPEKPFDTYRSRNFT